MKKKTLKRIFFLDPSHLKEDEKSE